MRDEGVEVGQGAEIGVNGVVAAQAAADRPWRTGVVGPGGEGVVGPLAVDLADRVDRREVDHVETHRGDSVEPLRCRGERAADDPARLLLDESALGAREELVPAAEERARPVGIGGVGPVDGDHLAQRVCQQHGGQLGRLQLGEARLDRAGRVRGGLDRASERCHLRGGELSGGVRATAGEDAFEQQATLREHQLHVDTGADLDAGVMLPGADRVGPRVDLERPRTGQVRRHPGAVAVDRVPVDHRLRLQPDRWASDALGVDEHHLGAEEIVSLPEDRCRDRERFADCRLGGQPAVVDQGHHVDHRDASDHDSTQSLRW